MAVGGVGKVGIQRANMSKTQTIHSTQSFFFPFLPFFRLVVWADGVDLLLSKW